MRAIDPATAGGEDLEDWLMEFTDCVARRTPLSPGEIALEREIERLLEACDHAELPYREWRVGPPAATEWAEAARRALERGEVSECLDEWQAAVHLAAAHVGCSLPVAAAYAANGLRESHTFGDLAP